MRGLTLLAAATLIPALALDAAAQRSDTEDTFTWSESMRSGAWLRIYNVNGEVRVQPGDGATATVRAEKRSRRGNVESARIEVVRDGDNVTLCTLMHENATCDRDGVDHDDGPRQWQRNNDVRVDYVVTLPRGVNVSANSVNGSVDVNGATGQVQARSVNGRVEAASSGGPVEARSVNGSVRARMAQLPAGGESLEFGSVNGSVVLELPASLDADLELSTVNGTLRTDFPVTINGEMSRRRLEGRIGRGGRDIRVRTVNGSIELRKLE